jgi:thymidylate synthase ThyX
VDFAPEHFTDEERAILGPHFTNLDGPVFALIDLPEVVKGALFARYSRSPKSLRRLFLDEFISEEDRARILQGKTESIGTERATALYERVFLEYGDDSVAQLGGVHLACEQSSQILAKVLEWGRLAAYLEQSTRYVPYDDRPGGRWRYAVPDEVTAVPRLRKAFETTIDQAFETYAAWLGPLQDLFAGLVPRAPEDSEFVHRMTIRAKACDALRGLLPAATRTNVGIFATAQAYEQLLIRMRATPLAEVQAYADLMLTELRKVIPAFLTRVDRPDRGMRWSEYLRDTRAATTAAAARVLSEAAPEPRPEVVLTDFEPDGEVKVVAAALYAVSSLPDDQLLSIAQRMSADERLAILRAYVGDRTNRRHKPGRAFERTAYRFDVLCDYGAFRDLQRHRTLTIEWQALSPAHRYEVPPEVEAVGAASDWHRVMEQSAALHGKFSDAGLEDAAPYAVAMAYRVRFFMHMNAREAMHVIELRTTPQGHPTYRRVCQQMHRLITEQAGHHAIAGAMSFVDHSTGEEGRLDAERRTAARRAAGT